MNSGRQQICHVKGEKPGPEAKQLAIARGKTGRAKLTQLENFLLISIQQLVDVNLNFFRN